MMDEVKLKNGIMWNCVNVITSVVTNEFDTKDIIKDIWVYLT